jgi:hypothetical protein
MKAISRDQEKNFLISKLQKGKDYLFVHLYYKIEYNL